MLIFIFLILWTTPEKAEGISCLSCSSGSFDGEVSFSYNRLCYLTDENTNVYQSTCASDTATQKYYCRTQIRLYDGIPKYVYRGCVSTLSDEDTTTTEIPSGDKCALDINTWDATTQTNCYFHCNTSGCNNVSIESLKVCNSDCGRNQNQGYCDYISGKCDCNKGIQGNNCTDSSVANRRKCVQCTTELDPKCEDNIISSYCSSGQSYCSAVHTTTYDLDGNIARSVFSKSCTSSPPRSECKISRIRNDRGINTAGYFENTCYSICNEDNCNANMNNQTVTTARTSNSLRCQRCSRFDGHDCNGNTICQANASYCISTVVYVISSSGSSSYQLMSVIRDCATSDVPTQCTSKQLGTSNVTKVTCQETCKEDGCNTGWPARPKCHQCQSDYYSSEHCVTGFSYTLQDCLPYQKYCTAQRTTKKFQAGIISSRIKRSCSNHDIGNGCSSYIHNNVTIETCNQTCSTEGCNSGYIDAESYSRGVVAVFLP
ncbi:uncharacterized protein LOC120330343 [Styela clava]